MSEPIDCWEELPSPKPKPRRRTRTKKSTDKPVKRKRAVLRKPVASAPPATQRVRVDCPPNPAVIPQPPKLVPKPVPPVAFNVPAPTPAPTLLPPPSPVVFDPYRDYYADALGPVPPPRYGVPTTGTAPLMALGIAGLGWVLRRRTKRPGQPMPPTGVTRD